MTALVNSMESSGARMVFQKAITSWVMMTRPFFIYLSILSVGLSVYLGCIGGLSLVAACRIFWCGSWT